MQRSKITVPLYLLSSGLYRRHLNFTGSARLNSVVGFTTGGEFHPAPKTTSVFIIRL